MQLLHMQLCSCMSNCKACSDRRPPPNPAGQHPLLKQGSPAPHPLQHRTAAALRGHVQLLANVGAGRNDLRMGGREWGQGSQAVQAEQQQVTAGSRSRQRSRGREVTSRLHV